MIEQKKNDWLATLFFSPDKTPQDLANLGITPDNSSLQDKDYYKNIPQIQEAFKTESGKFDESKFNNYYQEALKLYNDADNINLVGKLTNTYKYDPYDYFAPIGSEVREPRVSITRIPNPERKSQGMVSLRLSSAPTMSLREVAQQNKVFNVDTGKYEDWSPNDWGGLKAITRPTLVLATWDDDGTHEVDGRIVSHKKGEYKFNEKGDPYYETLGNRDVLGKDILHISDTLTVDGSNWNDYDLFDHDGLDKNATGIILETALKVAPMFIPYVGPIYGGITAALELGKLFPILYKTIEGIATGDLSNSKSAQTATNLQAWFSRFDGSISDAGQTGFWNLENLGRLITDSSKQLYQQQTIAKLPYYLNKLKLVPMTENTMAWGRGMSLAYMAGTSSVEAYDAFRDAGASDRVAGLGMLATMGAMHTLMNNEYFRDLWYEGTYLDTHEVKTAIRTAARNVNNLNLKLPNATTPESQKQAAKWYIKAQQAITEQFSKLKPGDLVYDALNEGIEETMEEVSMDTIKAIFAGLHSLGLVDKDTDLDFGITAQDMASRYFTSFVGGGIGGAVFSLHNRFNNRNNKTLNKVIKDGDGLGELVYLLREGKESQIRKELNRLHKSGQLGSTNLSGTELEFVRDEKTVIPKYKNATQGDSQNDLIFNQLNFYIDRISEIVREEGLDISDEMLQNVMLIPGNENYNVDELRYRLEQSAKAAYWEGIEKTVLKQELHTQLFSDWNNLTRDIIQTKVQIEDMLTPEENEPSTPKDLEIKIQSVQKSIEYQELSSKLQNLRKQRDTILSGSMNDFYVSQMLYAANPRIASTFVPGFGIHNFTRITKHKEYENLSEAEKAEVDSKYEQYTKGREKTDILESHKLFTEFQENLSTSIEQTAQKLKESVIYQAGLSHKSQLSKELTSKLNNLRTQLDTQIKALRDDQDTTEEIDSLKAEIDSLNIHLNNLIEYQNAVIIPALSDEGKKLLKRPETWSKSLLALDNYANSYLQFLKYISDNNLYLELTDGDLRSILSGWVDLNQLNGPNQNSVPIWLSKLEAALDITESNEILDSLAGKLAEITTAVYNGDYNRAIEIYNRIISDEAFENMGYLDVLDSIIPKIGNINLIDYLKQISDLKSNIKYSPVYDLLETASNISGVGEQEIIQTVLSAQNDLLNSKSIEEFIIRDPKSLIKLKETAFLINAVRAAVEASIQGSFNSKVNPFKTPFNKDLLSEIDSDSALRIINELERIGTQLDDLIQISTINLNQKLREQKDISMNMRIKFAEILAGDNFVRQGFKEQFGINLEEIAKELELNEFHISEDQFNEFDQKVIKFETAIFKAVSELNLTNNEIAAKLISIFNSDSIIKQQPTTLGKDKNIVISDYDKLMYLATILSTPSQNFAKQFKDVVSNPEYKLAPTFAQEYAERIGYGFINNPELFKQLQFEIKAIGSNSEDVYIKNKSNFFALTVFGGAGVGKTKGVAYTLFQMFQDASIIAVAPSSLQVNRLAESVGNTAKTFDKDTLINKILGRNLKSSDLNLIKEGDVPVHTLNPNIKTSNQNLFGDYNKKILVIDEISWFNRAELELISKWASENNIIIIALGDYKQNGSSLEVVENNKTEFIDSGIEDCWLLKTPDLVAPLRPDNIAKLDNYTRLSQELNKAYQIYFNNPSVTVDELNTSVKESLTTKVDFKYFETIDSFGGEKIISESEIHRYIDLFKKLPGTIAIITNNKQKYNSIGDSRIEVFGTKEVQGNEFDYVILDTPLNETTSGNTVEDFYVLKNIYTLTQRSRKGTTIVRKGLSLSYDSHLDSSSAGNIELSETQVEDYKNWRLSQLNNVSDETIDWSPKDTILPTSNNEKIIEQSNQSSPTEVQKQTIEPAETVQEASTEISDPSFVNNPEISKPDIITNEDVVEESGISEIKEDTRIKSNIGLVTENDSISSAEDWTNLINNKDEFKTVISSFNNYLNSPNQSANEYLFGMLRMYYLLGYYKNDPDNITKKNKALTKLKLESRSLSRKLENKISKLVNIEPEFHIISYNRNGLLVARINIDNEIIDIPLLITEPRVGQYFGDIKVASNFKYQTFINNSDFNFVNHTDFNSSALNPNQNFYLLGNPFVLIGSKDIIQNFTQEQQSWIRSRNGNTFMLATIDPFLDESDFSAFLEPYGNEYTTQHNQTISLFGANWTATLKDFINNALRFNLVKGKRAVSGAKSIINGTRAGQIISIVYNKYPNQVLNGLNKIFKGRYKIQVNDQVAENPDELRNILLEINDVKWIRQVYFNPNEGWKVEQVGEYLLNYVFENNIFTEAQIDELNTLCENSSQFKQLMYAKDIGEKQINGVYFTTNPNKNFRTNISSFYGCDFAIDLSQVDLSEDIIQNKQKLDSLNNQLKELGIDHILTSLDNIESVINDINSKLIEQVKSPIYTLLNWDGSNFIMESNDNFIPMIANYLKLAPEEFTIDIQNSSKNISKFTPFFVTLQNGSQQGYVLINTDDDWEIKNYKIVDEFRNLQNTASQYKHLMTENITRYIKLLLNDDPIRPSEAKDYLNDIIRLEMTGVETAVNNFLQTKLENAEC